MRNRSIENGYFGLGVGENVIKFAIDDINGRGAGGRSGSGQNTIGHADFAVHRRLDRIEILKQGIEGFFIVDACFAKIVSEIENERGGNDFAPLKIEVERGDRVGCQRFIMRWQTEKIEAS